MKVQKRKRKEMIIMMCAYEIVVNVEAKKKAEEEAKRRVEQKIIAEAIEVFKENLESIDAYVEKKLIEGEGKACLMIEKSYPNGFWNFTEKDYRYFKTMPYWFNKRMTKDFPLDIYIEYLREHCFNVEIIECPFNAYSSTGKTFEKMPGITLKISV